MRSGSCIRGASAAEIAESIETALREGKLGPGEKLPTVRGLAAELRVSPTTVAAAYQSLRLRGVVSAAGRRGSTISIHPPLRGASPVRNPPVPPGSRDLASGGPDPDLLPPLGPALRALAPAHVLYDSEPCDPRLFSALRRDLDAEGLASRHLMIVSGALDGIDRALAAWLRPGDRVAVEDPGYPAAFHLLASLGLAPLPVAIDDFGPKPDELERALRAGARAVLVTPRAQNPTGAALDAKRATELRAVLCKHPDVLVLEDDHCGPVAGAPALSLCDADTPRFALIRSVSKWLGPDLRLAFVSGDVATIARIEGRQALGSRWVSHMLQSLVLAQLRDRAVRRAVRIAERAYSEKRRILLEALAAREIRAQGRSGLNVWVPVPDEESAARALLAAGFAASAGARFRLRAPPALRITVSMLRPEDAERVAEALAGALRPARAATSV